MRSAPRRVVPSPTLRLSCGGRGGERGQSRTGSARFRLRARAGAGTHQRDGEAVGVKPRLDRIDAALAEQLVEDGGQHLRDHIRRHAGVVVAPDEALHAAPAAVAARAPTLQSGLQSGPPSPLPLDHDGRVGQRERNRLRRARAAGRAAAKTAAAAGSAADLDGRVRVGGGARAHRLGQVQLHVARARMRMPVQSVGVFPEEATVFSAAAASRLVLSARRARACARRAGTPALAWRSAAGAAGLFADLWAWRHAHTDSSAARSDAGVLVCALAVLALATHIVRRRRELM